MNRFSFAILFSLFACSQAFMATSHMRSPTLTSLNVMSQEETAKVIAHANDCVEGECSLDEVDELISLLKDQQKELFDRVEDVRSMVKSLETINAQDDREIDQIKETVRAIFRVFQLGDKASNNDYPSLSKPMGWSGEVGNGPTTAYDALPPKPFKKSP